jgi:hypothetical protein
MKKIILVVVALGGLSITAFADDYSSTQQGSVEMYHLETPTTTTDGGRLSDTNGNYIFLEGRTSGTDGPHHLPSPNPGADVYTQGNIGIGTDF